VAKSHEYLIEQIQYTPLIAVTPFQSQVNIQTDFNHPIKEFIFVCQRDFMDQVNEPFNFSSLATNEALDISAIGGYLQPGQTRTDLIATALLQLDGYDRFQVRAAPYFRLIQPYDHHTTTPVQQFIYCYCMALRPEDAQPTGTLNASRIDSVNWQITMNPVLNMASSTNSQTSVRGPATIRIYALNYNVFRVVNGFGGVLFTI
jgi:Large eukaryotic DNA virus major capsid protein